MKTFIIAIDGPAGSGKSTIAKKIAKKYKLTYLDTGAMYRMVTLYFIKNDIDVKKNVNINDILDKIVLDIKEDQFFLNGENVSSEIRTPEVSSRVSVISAIKEVRAKLVEHQRELSHNKRVIIDGRDIGTVVFPNAQVKIFLMATPEERAYRRYKEYQEKGINESYENVLESIRTRDIIDSTRKESPLIKASDATEIDTSHMGIDEVIAVISGYIDKVIEGF
ncbi:(d)CMP kinase [Fusobacterium sp. PH5-44]|uniref:(d)CMP kinase n=1 Tax=unclassified Fusobacterium TaxID=2648384 RepID=UPI003D2044BA